MSPRTSEKRPRISLPITPPSTNTSTFPSSYVTSSPTSYTTPTSSPSRSVVMGGLVSRPTSPDWDEKRALSIDVPGIVLTEPPINRPLSPPPKSITLLPPTSLELPLSTDQSPSPSTISRIRSHLPIINKINGRTTNSRSAIGFRNLLLLLLMILGLLHLWFSLGYGLNTAGSDDGEIDGF